MTHDLKQAENHFAFGRNWAEYAATITDGEIAEAQSALKRLLDGKTLAGARVLDIGSGSGLHSLAAIRLGAQGVTAVDIDADSAATTRAVLSRLAPGADWRVDEKSVFDLSPVGSNTFDVVYSWGVLHHTGDMWQALRTAAAMVAPGGLFVFALYRRVWMDWFWRREKRWYARASASSQAKARALYVGLFRVALLATGRRFSAYVANYRGNRGMSYYHDVHDWLGGWPYESVSAPEIARLMAELGFEAVRLPTRTGRVLGRDVGLFGSGCDEYAYRRAA